VKQSKFMSWVETCLNTGIGFVIAITAQVLVFPLFGFNPPLSTNFNIALIFTVISIVRGFILRRAFEALHIRRPVSPFMHAVVAERFRQKEQEGWSDEHDDLHPNGDLATAGATYAQYAGIAREAPSSWPWSPEWWKPAGFRRDLVKAAALIIAEGDKFDRSRKHAARS
jgi:hypothetical protein